jgi:phosphoribosylanthranilate isomerase
MKNDPVQQRENQAPNPGTHLRVKVCGMKYRENMEAVAALRPDYMGFIFWEPSKRFFNGDMGKIDPSIQKVGVFVDAPLQEILQKVKQYDLQAVQLHGNENPDFCRQLKQQLDGLSEPTTEILDPTIKIIKVFALDGHFDLGSLTDFGPVSDFYLFDTKGPLPGGNGYGFNWELLNDYPGPKPFFLSGGIGPEDVEKLGRFLQSPASKYCHSLDVNSKFERRPGLKDIDLLKTFIKNHRRGFRPLQE